MRYCIKGIVDTIFYRHARVDTIQTTKNRMASELAKEFIKIHAPAEPMRDPKTGALLDHAVAIAEGARLPDYWRDHYDGSTWARPGREEWKPSERWDQGGPIIEREEIRLDPPRAIVFWGAEKNGHMHHGKTPLIAAMRTYVASKLGDEVEL